MTNFKYEDAELAFSRVNRDLERLASWATKSFMEFNPNKTKYMVVTNTPAQHMYFPLYLNGTELEKVHTYPQLGLYINDRMNWDEHINHTITKASRKIGLMLKGGGG